MKFGRKGYDILKQSIAFAEGLQTGDSAPFWPALGTYFRYDTLKLAQCRYRMLFTYSAKFLNYSFIFQSVQCIRSRKNIFLILWPVN